MQLLNLFKLFISLFLTRKKQENNMKLTWFAFLLICCCLAASATISHANQINYLQMFIKSRQSKNPPSGEEWPELDISRDYSPVYVSQKDGSMKADKIDVLPGQPAGVNFDQYSGYVTVDPKAGRALFYYFAESPENSSTKPLVLWLNGGPGCSSLIGAMEELGPFRVHSDGKTLFRNPYAWNNEANVIFLESPAGVGFSYSNITSDYKKSGDKNTAKDAYIFLVKWLERFPQYKTRDLYIAGESYSGHYVPQLAYTILLNNKNTNQTVINLKDIAIGNAWIDDYTNTLGLYDYFWTHALNSDETNEMVHKYCDSDITSSECLKARHQGDTEHGHIDTYNIYAPLCHDNESKNGSLASVKEFDPCTAVYTRNYLNLPEVQEALHAKPTTWTACNLHEHKNWTDAPTTVLPIIKQLMARGVRVWIYSGDTDATVPVTSSRYSINTFKLPIKTTWYPWYLDKEVGGYAVEYEGMVFATVRGAGHLVPSYQPERALTLIASFLQGKLPPKRFQE